MRLDAPGYDLLALITGSEGLLAIITEVTVKLTPKPQAACCVLAAFDDLTKAGDAVAAIIGAGIIPAGLEMMDKLTIGAVEPFVHAGYPLDAEAILLCESDGVPEEVAEEIATVRDADAALRRDARRGVADARRSGSSSGRDARRRFRRRAASHPTTTASTERSRAARLRRSSKQIGELSQEFGLRCMNVFHAGDGNLHPLILYDANLPGDAREDHRLRREDSRICASPPEARSPASTASAWRKSMKCACSFRRSNWSAFMRVKHAFDPDGLLNPGKAVPLLHRCAEMGRMHVHRGQLPHADLPRF